MKTFILILFACYSTVVLAQEDSQIQTNYWVNIGLKTTIHSLPHHKPLVTPYLSFKINRVEIGGIWWRYKTNDPQGHDQYGQPVIDLKSERYNSLSFINVFLDRSKNWYIGLGYNQSYSSQLKYDRISGVYNTGIIDPYGFYIYEYGSQLQIFEVSEKTKILFLSTGLKIPIIKNLVVQPEIKVGIQNSKRTIYQQRVVNPDDMDDSINNYWLQPIDELRSSILFGLDIIYQIPL